MGITNIRCKIYTPIFRGIQYLDINFPNCSHGTKHTFIICWDKINVALPTGERKYSHIVEDETKTISKFAHPHILSFLWRASIISIFLFFSERVYSYSSYICPSLRCKYRDNLFTLLMRHRLLLQPWYCDLVLCSQV